MREGDLIELEVTRSGWDGAGRAQRDGTELHVAHAFAGERVRARLVRLGRRSTRGRARMLELLEPHPGRIAADCPHHPSQGGRCDGCAFMPLSLDAQRETKRVMLDELGLTVEQVEGAGPPWGYRHSSKRVAFGKGKGLYLGSYQRGSHRGARMDGCRVDHPKLREAARAVQEAARQLRVDAFDERTGQGDLRYVWLRTDGARVVVTLVAARADGAAATTLPETLPEWLGVATSVHGGADNSLRGNATRCVRPATELELQVGSHRVSVGPLGFMQPNPTVAARCYAALVGEDREGTAGSERAIDLYAGAGLTTAMLRARFADVIVSEAYPESARALGVKPEDAAACLARVRAEGLDVDLVVANPPRAGLSQDTCDALLRLSAPRVHIMSCGPKALARNLRTLSTGDYQLTSLRAFDTLPQTPHVELVARLARRGSVPTART